MVLTKFLKDLKVFFELTLYKSDKVHITVLSILLGVFILFLTYILIKVVKRLIIKKAKVQDLNEGSKNSIFQITKYFIWVIAILVALETVGVNISIFLAGGAALLVGVGLGLQQLFNDVASGIIILIEQNLKKGDIIEIENGTMGAVVEIGLRTSTINTFDNIIITVPNSKFVNDAIVNWSHLDVKTRYRISVGVAYGSDTALVQKILMQCAASHKEIKTTPAPVVRFMEFGDSSLNFQLLFWCTDLFNAESIKSDIRLKVDKLFKENNITIPFPQRDLHIKTNDTV